MRVSKPKILTPAAASFTTAGGGYALEMEALERLGAEIVECAPTAEAFIAAAPEADAVYAKGMKFTAPMIEALTRCRHPLNVSPGAARHALPSMAMGLSPVAVLRSAIH